MYVICQNKATAEKYAKCKTEFDRNLFVLSSGQESARLMINSETGASYYRPAIGKFVIPGEKDGDDFKYAFADEASEHGKILRKKLEEENRKLASAFNEL